MTRTTTRTRHGAHRGGRTVVGALLPSVLAVAAVSALITALAVWQAEEPSRPDRAAAASSPTETGTPNATPTPTPTPTATATPTTTRVETSVKARSKSATQAAAPAEVEVVVLNQTSRGGLAGTVAASLRNAGWDVPAVGNFRGVVPETTVYFPEGTEDAALEVAKDLPTEPRLRPRFGNLSTTRLTVVVTDSYPG